ncbi:Alpha/beta hydrolase [Candidatus Magnetomoraceae bacterium gMMP-15]
MEKKIFFTSQDLKIEGLVNIQDGDKAVVITHPHPLYGGDMYNHVVESIARLYQKKSYTTLRFNFRGAGRSQGSYDQGIGEQEDLCSALKYLLEIGKTNQDLAGYSFGTWINSMAVQKQQLNIKQMIMVSPPVAFIDFSAVSFLPKLELVITGSKDDLAPPEEVLKNLSKWNPKAHFEILDGADHFFSGCLNNLEKTLEKSLKI